MSDLTNLTTARTRLLTELASVTSSPKKSYSIDGQSVDHNAYRRSLLQEIKEINELLAKSQIDLAFICSGPYVDGKEKYGFQLVATPEVQNSHFYHSYLIVNKTSEFLS